MQVIVAVEGRNVSNRSCWETGAVEAAGDQVGGALRVDVGDRGLPAGDFRHGVQHLLRRCCGFVVTNHGDAPRVGIEAANVCALHGLIEAAVTALVDGAVLIHQCVVSDIAPAQVLRVVLVDSAHLRCSISLGVVVAARGVVQGQCLNAVVVVWPHAALRLVRTPACAGDDLWHAVGDSGLLDSLASLRIAVNEDSLHALGAGVVCRRARFLCARFLCAGILSVHLLHVSHRRNVTDVVRQRRRLRVGCCFRGLFNHGLIGVLRRCGSRRLACRRRRCRGFLCRGLWGLRTVFFHGGFLEALVQVGARDKIDVVDGNLHVVGGSCVNQLGAVSGVRIVVGITRVVHVVPLGPRTVSLLGAHESSNVTSALPGHSEHGERLVPVELLDGAGAVAFALGRDSSVIDNDGFAVAKARRGGSYFDGAGAVFLGAQHLVATEGGSRNHRDRGDSSDDRSGPLRLGRNETAS